VGHDLSAANKAEAEKWGKHPLRLILLESGQWPPLAGLIRMVSAVDLHFGHRARISATWCNLFQISESYAVVLFVDSYDFSY